MNNVAPSNLVYSANPATYTVATAITNNTPSNSGGTAISYSVSPALPAGLSLNTSTGVISGTPTTVTSSSGYTVTASNTGGSTTVIVDIAINDIPPTNFGYSSNPSIYTIGTKIANNIPSNNGGTVISYSVSPPLPAGLIINTNTGVISGTPTAVTGFNYYVVTASNTGGSITATLEITVNDIPPTSLGYSTDFATYHEAMPIINNTPSNGGGTITSYTVSPFLPAGIVLNASTGVISGTPTSIAATATYTITGSNSGGSTTTNITFTVSRHTIGTKGSLVSGFYHSCEIVNGGVRCWGRDNWGQLGDGSTSSKAVPVKVPGLSGVTALALGEYHTCALSNGGVKCWGSGGSGQLGDGNGTQSYTPVDVTGLTSGVQAIAAGDNHTCALSNGAVLCWGDNYNDALGSGSDDLTQPNSLVPLPVSGLTSGVQAIAAGGHSACALVSGTVQCWGWNNHGQLGNNSNVNSPIPVLVNNINSGVSAIAVGYEHTCAIVNGGLKCWGRNAQGQLGTGDTSGFDQFTPQDVPDLPSNVQSVVNGLLHTCAMADGNLYCWGYNDGGQLGYDITATPQSYSPLPITGITGDAQAIDTGTWHTCVMVNGALKCWGDNRYGQLGDNTFNNNINPVDVTGLSGGIQAIASGRNHSCLVLDGTVKCWGYNGDSEFGNGGTANSTTPVAVSNITGGVQDMSAGTASTCAIVNGGAQCWGSNAYGELGDGTQTNKPTPAVFRLFRRITDILAPLSTVAPNAGEITPTVNWVTILRRCVSNRRMLPT